MEDPAIVIQRRCEANNISPALLFGRFLQLFLDKHRSKILRQQIQSVMMGIMEELSEPLQAIGKADQFPISLLEAMGNSVQLSIKTTVTCIAASQGASDAELAPYRERQRIDLLIDGLIKELKNQAENHAISSGLDIVDQNGQFRIDRIAPPDKQSHE